LDGSVVAEAAMVWISFLSVSPAWFACEQKPDPDPLCTDTLEDAEEAIDDAADDADPAALLVDELEDELPHAAAVSASATAASTATRPRMGEKPFAMRRVYSTNGK
jgi:hypothetical protein